jgi:hypothetical protein
MPRPQKPKLTKRNPIVEGAEKAAAALSGFDYGVDAEDFILYELHRLIEEDRASFDDPEFRALIDTGVRAHIAENLETRAQIAGILRKAFTDQSRTVILRIVHALEDLNADLCNVGVLVRNYTEYLFSRLETLPEAEGEDRISEAADLLFESVGDREASETALMILCAARTPVSARVLAHAVSEPLLDEDLEAVAFAALKSSWPLPRHYILYNLQGHPHEDIPFRWFQLFVEVDELTTVDLVLEELRAHAESDRYREDLAALFDVLHGCRDPELEDKILGALNSSGTQATAPAASELLRKFLEEHTPVKTAADSPWANAARQLELNHQYVEAATLFDRGDSEQAREAVKRILQADPRYPFAPGLLDGR